MNLARMALALLFTIGLSSLSAASTTTKVWTDPNDGSLPNDFKFQGEYAATGVGVQVIALGKGAFQAVVYQGGLPGSGWTGDARSLMSGQLKKKKVTFQGAEGPRSYLAAQPESFSATQQFPPKGHIAISGSINRRGRSMTLMLPDGTSLALKKVIRESATLNLAPSENATILFDGQDTQSFSGGRLDQETKLLNTDGNDIRTRQSYQSYRMHLEFMLPFRPEARGQGRGNSGFYQVDHYEVQILDSFGLEGLDNECGGVYPKASPKTNMCFPPLQWQTYDVVFRNAVRDGDHKISNAQITLYHNGVLIHDNLDITGTTGGSRLGPEGTPGPIKLQGHGNPLQFRNIWIAEINP